MNQQELANRLAQSIEYSKRLAALTNEELADELLKELWAATELFTANSDLLQAVIDRLRGDK